MALIYSLHSEILKLLYKRATHVVLFLILVFQTFLANIGASQIVSVGIHATPATNPELAEAIPPIEFLGFDVTLFGVFIMIILGSIYGAEEYKRSAIRTSLLSITNRSSFLVSKTLVWLIFSFIISFLSIFLTINMTHYVLGQDGLLLFSLNGTVWFYIFLASIAWTLLGLLAYIMALTFKTAIVPLLFLLPQVYNLGTFLANYISAAKFLPVALGQGLIATSPQILEQNSLQHIFLLLCWNFSFLALAIYRLLKSDIGGGE